MQIVTSARAGRLSPGKLSRGHHKPTASIVNKTFNIRYSLLVTVMLLMMGGSVSCNSKSDDSEEEVAVTSSTVAVNSFSLSANKKVAPALDSVFFSIDLNNAVIFNADSLPKGAEISKLVPVISFASSMKKAEIAVVDEKGDTLKKVDYLKTKTDSIDFNRNVTLAVTSFDGQNSLTYRLKVNVHKENPDSIGWTALDVASAPSRLAAPLRRKTVVRNSTPFSLVEETDHTFTLCKASDIFGNSWETTQVEFPFTPAVTSLTASAEKFYILSEDGQLYSSPDASQWTELASDWMNIIGIYGSDRVVGIKNVGDVFHHAYFANGNETVGESIPGDFPVSGMTAFVSVANRWAEEPVSFFAGGVCRNGTYSSAVWGFDGTSWATLSQNSPALYGAGMVKYVMYRYPTSASKIREVDVWLLLGGRNNEDEVNRTVYMSYDNGINWRRAGGAMDLPATFPNVAEADIFTVARKESADLADSWKNILTRASYEIEGTDIIWECPYIFIIGGYTPSGTLSDDIWRGVLMRLNFSPLI